MFETDTMKNIESMKEANLAYNINWVKPSDQYIMFLNGLCKEHKERINDDDDLESGEL